MSEIDKIKRYIARTKMAENIRYSMNLGVVLELQQQAHAGGDIPIWVISLAFDYGKAKGYRAAKAEGRSA